VRILTCARNLNGVRHFVHMLTIARGLGAVAHDMHLLDHYPFGRWEPEHAAESSGRLAESEW